MSPVLKGNTNRAIFGASKPLLRLGIAVFLGLLAGCSSTPPEGQMSDSSVLILNRSPEEIGAAVKDTFKRHQFDQVSPASGDLLFQKRGSFMNDFMSPNWFDGATWVQVKVLQRQLDPERTELDYRAYIVQQPDDPMFEKQQPYGGHKREFKNLLMEIARNLNQPSGTPSQ
jgi:hypothetical protein